MPHPITHDSLTGRELAAVLALVVQPEQRGTAADLTSVAAGTIAHTDAARLVELGLAVESWRFRGGLLLTFTGQAVAIDYLDQLAARSRAAA